MRKSLNDYAKQTFINFDLGTSTLNKESFNDCLSRVVLKLSDYVNASESEFDSARIDHDYIIINNEVIRGGQRFPLSLNYNEKYSLSEKDLSELLKSISR